MKKSKKNTVVLDDLFFVDKYGNKWGITALKALYLTLKRGTPQIIQYKTKKSYLFKLDEK